METLILTFPCKPGLGKELIEALKTALIETRAYQGCLTVIPYTSASNPDDIVLFEEWDSKESQVTYMKWRAETGMSAHLAPLLTGPPKEEWLDSLDL